MRNWFTRALLFLRKIYEQLVINGATQEATNAKLDQIIALLPPPIEDVTGFDVSVDAPTLQH